MPDLLLGASAHNAGIAVFAAITTDLVSEIQRRHDLAPTATAAAGRLVTGAVLFGASLKGRERVSLQVSGDGPIGTLSADAWLLEEHVVGARAYARNGDVDLPLDARGKFDVGGAVGSGLLQITKSYEAGQPYVGVVPLQSGEIAEDLAVYLAQSEQIPSIVALGVLANPSGVIAAGGIIAQVLPGADERVVAALEERALAMPPVTQLIASEPQAQRLLHEIAGDLELRGHRSLDVRFACLCTAQKVEAALLGLGAQELRSMVDERGDAEATCEYCKKVYVFSSAQVRDLIERVGRA